jgi:hypothetical protein
MDLFSTLVVLIVVLVAALVVVTVKKPALVPAPVKAVEADVVAAILKGEADAKLTLGTAQRYIDAAVEKIKSEI